MLKKGGRKNSCARKAREMKQTTRRYKKKERVGSSSKKPGTCSKVKERKLNEGGGGNEASERAWEAPETPPPARENP